MRGQPTNCKVNHNILLAAQNGRAMDLWMHKTADPRPLKARLVHELAPPWNARR